MAPLSSQVEPVTPCGCHGADCLEVCSIRIGPQVCSSMRSALLGPDLSHRACLAPGSAGCINGASSAKDNVVPCCAGSCDKTVKMWNLATNQSQVVAKHDAPVRHVHHLKDMNNMLVTGSWDKTVRYWDLRQPNPVHTQQLPERVYSMDVRHPLLVVGLANRRIQVGACYEQVPAPCFCHLSETCVWHGSRHDGLRQAP